MTLRAKQAIDLYLGGALIVLLRPWVYLVGRLLRRDHALRVGSELCIVKMLGGGSLVIALPALLGIRKAHPGAKLALVTTPALAQFARAVDVFDEIRVIDDRGPAILWTGAAALARSFRADTIVDLEAYSRLTTVFSLLTCARNRVSFYLENSYWRRYVSSHLIYFNRFSGVFHFYDQIARLLGAEPASRDDCAERVARFAGPGCPRRPQGSPRRIAIGHGCSDLVAERMLPPEAWARRLADEARRGTIEAHLLGGERERGSAEAIGRLLERAGIPWVNHCAELPLAGSLGCLREADEFWGIDSALLHFARLLRVPSVSFWGPTDPATRLRPIAGLRETVHYAKTSCSPCVHVAETPPCSGDNVCMRRLAGDGAEAPLWIVGPEAEARS